MKNNLPKSTQQRLNIAQVIIDLNQFEYYLKEIIGTYIGSEDVSKNDFIYNILLNNDIINFNNKFKLLQFIAKKLNVPVSKEFKNSVKIIMQKRNILAHSDTLTLDIEIVPFDDPDGFAQQQIISKEPDTLVFNGDGTFNKEAVEKIIIDFNKHWKIAMEGLEAIRDKMYDQLINT